MTDNSTPAEGMKEEADWITQSDRNAAADYFAAVGEGVRSDMARSGRYDLSQCVQAFAAHRRAHPPAASPAGASEASLRMLDTDTARLALWQAIEAIRIGNKHDDKLIIANLAKVGVYLASPAEGSMMPSEEGRGVDPRTGRAFGDHGSHEDAIKFALEVHDDTLQTYEFLQAWSHGDLEEWPEYYRWLSTRLTPDKALMRDAAVGELAEALLETGCAESLPSALHRARGILARTTPAPVEERAKGAVGALQRFIRAAANIPDRFADDRVLRLEIPLHKEELEPSALSGALVVSFDGVTVGDLRALAATNAPPTTAADELVIKALKAAQQFITNGVEMGYIRMPDPETPDSAHYTLPMIETALAALRPQAPTDGEKGQ